MKSLIVAALMLVMTLVAALPASAHPVAECVHPASYTSASDNDRHNTALMVIAVIVGAIIVIGFGLLALDVAVLFWPVTVIILLANIAFHMC